MSAGDLLTECRVVLLVYTYEGDTGLPAAHVNSHSNKACTKEHKS